MLYIYLYTVIICILKISLPRDLQPHRKFTLYHVGTEHGQPRRIADYTLLSERSQVDCAVWSEVL
jgi:hypothetical protein